MTILIWIYIGLYVALWTFMVWVESVAVPEEDKDPGWERALDGSLIILGFFGMMLYQKDPGILWLSNLWKVVAVGLPLIHGALNLRSGLVFLRDPGSLREEGWAVLGGAAIAAFLVLPSSLLNYLYAFH